MADVSAPPTVIPPPKAPSYVESIVAGLLSILFCLGTTDATGALPEASSQASAPAVRVRAATPAAPVDETEAAAQVIQSSIRSKQARGRVQEQRDVRNFKEDFIQQLTDGLSCRKRGRTGSVASRQLKMVDGGAAMTWSGRGTEKVFAWADLSEIRPVDHVEFELIFADRAVNIIADDAEHSEYLKHGFALMMPGYVAPYMLEFEGDEEQMTV